VKQQKIIQDAEVEHRQGEYNSDDVSRGQGDSVTHDNGEEYFLIKRI
jgi:hypothetical protein